MIFTPTKLKDAYVIDLDKREDERGFFARTWCVNELSAQGLSTDLKQQNMSATKLKGTLRGMHFQAYPHEETKLIRCTRGKIYDVIIDLRPDSVTYCQWLGTELSDENYRQLYVPKYFAHGFVTLSENCEVTYLVTASYHKEADNGVRYNDKAFNISWPISITHVSEKDAHFPDYQKIVKENK